MRLRRASVTWAVVAAAFVGFWASVSAHVTSAPPPPAVVQPAASHTATTVPQRNQTYVRAAPLVLSGCQVAVSRPAPPRADTAEIVTVSTTPGAVIRMEAVYARAKSAHGALADAQGQATFDLPISDAPPGVTVPVTAQVILGKSKQNCATSFTPVWVPLSHPTRGSP
jgi:hypothetical protein